MFMLCAPNVLVHYKLASYWVSAPLGLLWVWPLAISAWLDFQFLNLHRMLIPIDLLQEEELGLLVGMRF